MYYQLTRLMGEFEAYDFWDLVETMRIPNGMAQT